MTILHSCTSEPTLVDGHKKDADTNIEEMGSFSPDQGRADIQTHDDAALPEIKPEVQLRLFNVFRNEEDPRFEDLPTEISVVQLTPESTLLFQVPEKYQSIRVSWEDGNITETERPFRLNDISNDAQTLDWTTIGNTTFEIQLFESNDLSGDSTVIQRSLQLTQKGMDLSPEDGAHRRVNFWKTSAGDYVHRDADNNFVDSDNKVILNASDVNLENLADGISYLRTPTGEPTLDFAFIVLLPEGFDPTVPYPLFVLLHSGYNAFYGSDNDGLSLSIDYPFRNENALNASPNRHENPSIIVIPQYYKNYEIDGVFHKWAAFTGIEDTTPGANPRAITVNSTEEVSLNSRSLFTLLEELLAGEFQVDNQPLTVDPARLYLTGNSMGGTGTWDFIARHPKRWAAGVPMAGYADHSKAADFVDVPIWAFHHREDCVNPAGGTMEIFDIVTKMRGGKEMRLTTEPLLNLPDGERCRRVHSYTPQVWNLEPDLYRWLFSQVNKN